MDIQFELCFKHYGDNWEDKRTINDFYDNEHHLYELPRENVVELTENLNLSVKFNSSCMSARFYMDGLDTLPEQSVSEDEVGEAFLSPHEEFQEIFSYDSEGFYPLIPGYYRMKIQLKERTFYSWVKVKPKELSEEEWTIMRDDIEKGVNGLAQDILRKNSSLGLNESSLLPITNIRKLLYLQEKFGRISTALSDLYKKPKYTIIKEYYKVPKGKSTLIDERSIHYHSRHPETKDMVLQPKRRPNYNLQENKILKRIISFLLKEMNAFLLIATSYKDAAEEKYKNERDSFTRKSLAAGINDVSELIASARKIRSYFTWFNTNHWIVEVKEPDKLQIPHSMNLDHRYRTIYQIYRAMKSDEMTVTLDSSYSYHWKRTDLLYEIWGFLQLTKIMCSKDVGFNPISGWIFDQDLSENSIIIPVLSSDTCILFKKDEISVRMYYDTKIPRESKDTTLENPIYTSGVHNRPDTRIDIYKKDIFCGSILVDFKYRPLKYIWNHNKIRTNRQSKVMSQLDSYKSNCRSKFLYKDVYPKSFVDRMHTVTEVWGLFPGRGVNANPRKPLEEYGIRIMEFCPGKDLSVIKKSLMEVLEREVRGIE